MAYKSVVLPPGVANYVAIFTPKLPPNSKEGSEKKYSVTLTYDKAEGKKVLAPLMKAALEVAEEKWPGKGEKIIKGMKWPVVADGDERLSPTTGEPMFPGKMFVVAKRNETFGPPGVVSKNGQRIIDSSKVYSGAIVRVEVTLFPFSHPQGGLGVGVGLSNVMLVADGERLDGRKSPEEAFADYIDAVEDSGGDDASGLF